MLRNESKQLNFYSLIYDRIPENHLLKQIDKAVSFDFVNEMLKDSYCSNFGRPAKEPEMMVKILSRTMGTVLCLGDVLLI